MTTMRLESAKRRASKEGYTSCYFLFVANIWPYFCSFVFQGPCTARGPYKQQEWAVLC